MDTPANIITVDWGKIARPRSLLPEAFYGFAALKVPIVGRKLSEFLVYLVQQKLVKGPEDIHLVGHSLGAHVSGKAGRYFKQSTGTQLKRITGLDPAGFFLSLP
jgi:hypothetical protein